ncbi:MAG TPA: FadR/GntR family transcriptional regulator [Burkholderiaceae bacterium]|jgi:DNA-binding FadR family transcriptional regulator
MRTVRPKSFHDQIVEEIGLQIVGGELAAGAQIPPEPVLAEKLGVGRLAVREAMKTLAAKGMVGIRPKTGTQVLPRASWNLFDPNVLQWHAAVSLDAKFVADLMELRRLIEPAAARIAAGRATNEQLAAMRQAYAAMESAVEHEDYIAADLRFHGAVLDACDNQFLHHLQGAISEVLKISFTASSTPRRDANRALALHRNLIDALEARDPQAAEAAVGHLIDRASERIRLQHPALAAPRSGEKSAAPPPRRRGVPG